MKRLVWVIGSVAVLVCCSSCWTVNTKVAKAVLQVHGGVSDSDTTKLASSTVTLLSRRTARSSGRTRGDFGDDRTLMLFLNDWHGQRLPYANVVVLATRLGTITDENGMARLSGLPSDSVSIMVAAFGENHVRFVAVIHPRETVIVDVKLARSNVIKTTQW